MTLSTKKRTKHKLANTEKERRDAGKEGRGGEERRRGEKKRAYQMSCVNNSHHPGRRGVTITPKLDTHGLKKVKLSI